MEGYMSLQFDDSDIESQIEEWLADNNPELYDYFFDNNDDMLV